MLADDDLQLGSQLNAHLVQQGKHPTHRLSVMVVSRYSCLLVYVRWELRLTGLVKHQHSRHRPALERKETVQSEVRHDVVADVVLCAANAEERYRALRRVGHDRQPACVEANATWMLQLQLCRPARHVMPHDIESTSDLFALFVWI